MDNFSDFQTIFGTSLSQFWPDHRYGFRLQLFRQWLGIAKDGSLLEYCRTTFGDDGAKLIAKLLRKKWSRKKKVKKTTRKRRTAAN